MTTFQGILSVVWSSAVVVAAAV